MKKYSWEQCGFGDRLYSRVSGRSTKLDYIMSIKIKTKAKQKKTIILTQRWPVIAVFITKDANTKRIKP